MIYLTSQWFRSVIAPALWGCSIWAHRWRNTGITAFRRAAGDAWIYGASGWFWMFVIEGLLAVGAGVFNSFGLMTHRGRHVF